MDGKVQEKELEVQAKTSALTQTELDLANAVLVIQEKESKLAEIESERDQAVEVVAELINEIPLEPTLAPQSIIPNLALTEDDADNLLTSTASSNAGFGTKFPTNPQKGDMFLRVDMLPNKLFKWNGQKWIEIAKTTTDRYAYEEEYIQYLLQKIRTREYTMDDLSPVERDQVVSRMSYNEKSKL